MAGEAYRMELKRNQGIVQILGQPGNPIPVFWLLRFTMSAHVQRQNPAVRGQAV